MTLLEWLAVSEKFVAVIIGLQLLLNIIGTNLFELQNVRRRSAIIKHPYARRLRVRPQVSVVVVVDHEKSRLDACIASLLRSTYRNFEIIIVDNAAHLGAGQVSAVKSKYPKAKINTLKKRIARDTITAARDGYKKYGIGELIMVLDAQNTVDKRAISLAVQQFNSNQSLQILTPMMRTNSTFSSLGVLRKYHELVSIRSQKWNSAFRSNYQLPSNFVCRAVVIKTSKALPVFNGVFADDVIVYDAAPTSLDEAFHQIYAAITARSQALKSSRKFQLQITSFHDLFVGWIRLPLAIFSGMSALVLPFLIGYIAFVAVQLHQPIYLLSAAGVVSLLMLFAIWEDNQLKLNQKIAYSLGIPLTFGPLLAVTVVQAIAIISELLLPKKRVSY